ncbi:MAG TPA: hypothetical protein VFN67_43010 [Polyangiales bacterium]|nr:hypothetical protein [Polyangiales bacterium]
MTDLKLLRLSLSIALPIALHGCSDTPEKAHDGSDKLARSRISWFEPHSIASELDATVDSGSDAGVDASVASMDRSSDAAAIGGGGQAAPARPHAAAAGEGGKGTSAAGTGGQPDSAKLGQGGGSAGAAAEPEVDPKTFAAELSGLFIDMPCDAATPTPIPEGMACSHASNTQHVEKVVAFTGKPGAHYTLTLRVRGIWEPTQIDGGIQPYPGCPFTEGGWVAQNPDGTPTNAINYQQFHIQVAEPAQIYWLNNYGAAAHEIHKEDYEASLEVAGGSEIKIIVHDGNDLEIGNHLQLMFTEFPPYDKVASLGQSLRLDVVKVVEHP